MMFFSFQADSLSLAFITGSGDSVLFRVDSAQSEDYLMLALIKGVLTVSYNLGTEDIVVTDRKRRLNDGLHHVVRFERLGPNSTLQVDDNKKISSTPDGERKRARPCQAPPSMINMNIKLTQNCINLILK